MEAIRYTEIHRGVIERCMKGERKAQYELYKLYSKAMYNVSLRITMNEAEAQDVLQEAFLNAFQNITYYKWEASFGSWLKKIVINQAISLLRKRKMQISSIEEESDFADVNESIDEEGLEYRVESLKKAMINLPEGYRVVLSLYLFEGYDHSEIAQVLNISETTSKTQYMRAKKKIIEIVKNK